MSSIQAYYEIIQKKTVSLFAGAAEISAILSGVDFRGRAKLRAYGLALGTLYQVIDDILDLTGDELVLGKTLRQDLSREITTLTMILYLGQSRNGSLIQMPDYPLDATQINSAIETLKKSGAIAASYSEAERYVESCKKSLEGFPDGVHRSTLMVLADYVLDQAKTPKH